MWRMLCERGKDLVIQFGDVHADDEKAARTGKPDVHFRKAVGAYTTLLTPPSPFRKERSSDTQTGSTCGGDLPKH